MFKSRREENQMKIDILKASTQEHTINKLIMLSNSSGTRFYQLLEKLTNAGLIRTEENTRDKRTKKTYHTTCKGVEIIRKWNEIDKAL
jgi:predicted transcriptional regulator